jgi:uncharacterized DUF497 family protein
MTGVAVGIVFQIVLVLRLGFPEQTRTRVLSYAHCVLTLKGVGFEWDELFDDPYAITIVDDESDPSERRFITLGLGAANRLLVVAYAWRGENIRIISARPAETHEREEYYEAHR